MNKPKLSIFGLAVSAIILLVLGKWVTPGAFCFPESGNCGDITDFSAILML
jgi:hypothetical protein